MVKVSSYRIKKECAIIDKDDIKEKRNSLYSKFCPRKKFLIQMKKEEEFNLSF